MSGDFEGSLSYFGVGMKELEGEYTSRMLGLGQDELPLLTPLVCLLRIVGWRWRVKWMA
jgi:hypothetical protein